VSRQAGKEPELHDLRRAGIGSSQIGERLIETAQRGFDVLASVAVMAGPEASSGSIAGFLGCSRTGGWITADLKVGATPEGWRPPLGRPGGRRHIGRSAPHREVGATPGGRRHSLADLKVGNTPTST
jgi:hypothetical protein